VDPSCRDSLKNFRWASVGRFAPELFHVARLASTRPLLWCEDVFLNGNELEKGEIENMASGQAAKNTWAELANVGPKPNRLTFSTREICLLTSVYRLHAFTDSSHKSVCEERDSRAQDAAVKKTHTKKSQAYTTNGARARGRREPGQKPRPRAGPVLDIPGAVWRHWAQPSASLYAVWLRPGGCTAELPP
jgi:hypothetical protein